MNKIQLTELQSRAEKINLSISNLVLLTKMFLQVVIVASLIVVPISGQTQSADVMSILDAPSFNNYGQNVWGPGVELPVLSFRHDVLDLNDQGTIDGVGGVNVKNSLPIKQGTANLICGTGRFIDPVSGDCFSCADGYSHDFTKPVTEPGVCFKKTNLEKATVKGSPEFFCGAGEFLDLQSGDCYSCPSGYEHHFLFDVDDPKVCQRNEAADYTGHDAPDSCDVTEGEFSGGLVDPVGCYSCPSGYSYTGLSVNNNNACKKRNNKKATFVKDVGSIFTPCPGGTFANFGSTKCHRCDSGYIHDPSKRVEEKGVCYKDIGTTATHKYNLFACKAGEFLGGFGDLNGCYTCPDDLMHDSGLSVNTPGVCYANSVAIDPQDVQLFCPSGEFYDVLTGKCASCPSGFKHDSSLPANQRGVCFAQDNQLALQDNGEKSLGCDKGQFYNTSDNSCYTCPIGFFHNPLASASDANICLSLEDGSAYDSGVVIDYDYQLKMGVSGGIEIQPGSVDIEYRPKVKIDISATDNMDGGEHFKISTSQDTEDSSLNMASSWPSASMWFDTYQDSTSNAQGTVHYPYPEYDKTSSVINWQQRQESFDLWDFDTNGEKSSSEVLFDESNIPMLSAQVGNGELNPYIFNNHICDITGIEPCIIDTLLGVFDPPLEISTGVKIQGPPLVPGGPPTTKALKKGPLGLGYVVTELGIKIPAMDVPLLDSEHQIDDFKANYEGEFQQQTVLSEKAVESYINHKLWAGNHTGVILGLLNQGLKAPDVSRLDIDLDGLIAVATNVPMGAQASMIAVPPLDWWNVSASAFDLDIGTVFHFEKDLKFEPNLQIKLNFSRPVQVETSSGSGVYQSTNNTSIAVGDDLDFIHPGGTLVITPSYTLANNRFSNDTNFMLTPLIEKEIVSVLTKGILLPKFSYKAVQATAELSPEPIKLADMDYYNADGDDTKSVFKLLGFEEIAGSQLTVTGTNQVPQAACRDVELPLSEDGSAILLAHDIDNGSSDPDGHALEYTLDTDSFSCPDIGFRTITLTVTDEFGLSDSCTAQVNIKDTINPTLSLGQDQTLEATSNKGAEFTPVFSAADNCGNVTTTVTPDSNIFPVGETQVEITTTDSSGNNINEQMLVTVVDTTAPTINSITTNPRSIWPPNRRFVPIDIIVDAQDAVDKAVQCKVTDVKTRLRKMPRSGFWKRIKWWLKRYIRWNPTWEMIDTDTVALVALPRTKHKLAIECRDFSGNISTQKVVVKVKRPRYRL